MEGETTEVKKTAVEGFTLGEAVQKAMLKRHEEEGLVPWKCGHSLLERVILTEPQRNQQPVRSNQ